MAIDPRYLAQLRGTLEEARSRLANEFLETENPAAYLKGHTLCLDTVVQDLADSQVHTLPLSIVATGGYGRGELFPCSDVDLLLVHRDNLNTAAETAIKAILHALWDLNLKLGHQVWSLDQLKELDFEHAEFIMALLDARLVAGDRCVGLEVVEERLPAFLERAGSSFVTRVAELVRKRHEGFAETIYQLEPDLKNAPGGLRDYLAYRWFERLGVPAISPFADDLETCVGFLQHLRIRMHLYAGREENRLSYRLQEKIGKQLGLTGTPRQRAEALMQEYFLKARVLHGACRHQLSWVFSEDGKSANPERFSRMRSWSDLLQGLESILEEGSSLSDAVAPQLSRLAERLPVPKLAELRALVCKLLRPRAGLYQILSRLDELGLLERLFPPFETIRGRVIRDFYHRYTVDEHTLLAIRNVEKLNDPEARVDGRFRDLLAEVGKPELLILALLLHDVGKGSGGSHAQRSAELAEQLLQQFEFDPSDIELVIFLVREHLAMSDVIFKRDLEDPEVIEAFSNHVSEPIRLRFLTLLTYADIKAVAPGTLNEWKRDLLWQLYVSTYRELTVGFGTHRIEERALSTQLLSQLPPGCPKDQFEDFLEGFPKRYLASTPPAEIYAHFQMAQQLVGSGGAQFRLVERKSHYELWVVTPDQARLFARIVGLLSYFEMNILRGYGFSNYSQTVLDFFYFEDERGLFDKNPDRKSQLLKMLQQSVAGLLSVERLVTGREESLFFRKPAAVIDNEIFFEERDTYTIMELVATDSVGLLYRISRQIAHLECDIDLALISTEGGKAVDVFYLRRQGGKLSRQVQEELRERILQSLQ